MPKVSVVIPVYGVEKYIERCARSLFEQTLDDIEYLFIDDCSPDNSIKLLKNVLNEYPHRVSKTTIFSMPTNSGLASVRKTGIQIATGEYLIHCDSDDWVDSQLYEQMYKTAIQTGSEVVCCPMVDEWEDRSVKRFWPDFDNDCQQIVQNWYRDSISMFTVNKLVKRSILKKHKLYSFEGINMWEDNGLMLRVLYYSHGLTQIYGSYYHYNRGNNTAITYLYGRQQINQMIQCAKLISEFFENKPDGDRYKKTVLTLKYLAKLNLVTTHPTWLREFYQLFPESNVAAKWISLDAFSRKGKIRFLFVKYHLAWLFVLIYRIVGVLNKDVNKQ